MTQTRAEQLWKGMHNLTISVRGELLPAVTASLGVAAYTFEMGNDFFQECPTFEQTIYPGNLPALLYAAKAARRPYTVPSGPDSLAVTTAPTLTGAPALLELPVDHPRPAVQDEQECV